MFGVTIIVVGVEIVIDTSKKIVLFGEGKVGKTALQILKQATKRSSVF